MTQAEIERQVRVRAGNRCEYCGMHQSLQGGTFHLEHVVPTSRSGESTIVNMALACPGCNLHKSDRVEVPDPLTGQSVPLFNPRQHDWKEHFEWDEFELVGRTVIGRATIFALRLNDPRRLQIRQAERMFDLFPPDDRP